MWWYRPCSACVCFSREDFVNEAATQPQYFVQVQGPRAVVSPLWVQVQKVKVPPLRSRGLTLWAVFCRISSRVKRQTLEQLEARAAYCERLLRGNAHAQYLTPRECAQILKDRGIRYSCGVSRGVGVTWCGCHVVYGTWSMSCDVGGIQVPQGPPYLDFPQGNALETLRAAC